MESNKPHRLVFIVLIVITIILTIAIRLNAQVMYDNLGYANRPGDIGMSQRIAYVYEFAITIRDEAAAYRQRPANPLTSRESNLAANAWTIEYDSVVHEMRKAGEVDFVVIDIESMVTPGHIEVKQRYLEIAQAATRAKVAFWNVGPVTSVKEPTQQQIKQEMGRADALAPLVAKNDFAVIAFYSNPTDDFETWAAKNARRLVETRRMYGRDKVFIAVLSPHYMTGSWPYKSYERMAQEIDFVAPWVDGIDFWYARANPVSWSPTNPAIRAILDRVSAGHYQPME